MGSWAIINWFCFKPLSLGVLSHSTANWNVTVQQLTGYVELVLGEPGPQAFVTGVWQTWVNSQHNLLFSVKSWLLSNPLGHMWQRTWGHRLWSCEPWNNSPGWCPWTYCGHTLSSQLLWIHVSKANINLRAFVRTKQNEVFRAGFCAEWLHNILLLLLNTIHKFSRQSACCLSPSVTWSVVCRPGASALLGSSVS